MLILKDADRKKIIELYKQVMSNCPTPEVYHHRTNWHLSQHNGRPEGTRVLESGAARFPNNARIRRRLAGIYRLLKRLEDAERILREAMALEPMMPDTYSLLGLVLADMGESRWEEAEQLIRDDDDLSPWCDVM